MREGVFPNVPKKGTKYLKVAMMRYAYTSASECHGSILRSPSWFAEGMLRWLRCFDSDGAGPRSRRSVNA